MIIDRQKASLQAIDQNHSDLKQGLSLELSRLGRPTLLSSPFSRHLGLVWFAYLGTTSLPWILGSSCRFGIPKGFIFVRSMISHLSPINPSTDHLLPMVHIDRWEKRETVTMPAIQILSKWYRFDTHRKENR